MSAFETFAKKYGGSVSTDSSDTEFFKRLGGLQENALGNVSAEIKKSQTTKNPIVLQFGFLASEAFDAHCCRLGSADIISLNIGIPVRMRMIFRSMLSQPGILPEIGQADISEPYSMPIKIDFFNELYGVPAIPAPLDPFRARYCNFLESAAFRLLFDHEFAHIFRGHYDLLNADKNEIGLDESGNNLTSRDFSIFRPMLEWDADSWSVARLFSSLRRHPNNDPSKKPIFHENPWNLQGDFLNTRSEFLKLYAFATYTAYRPFINSNELNSDDVAAWHHPPAALRAWSAIFTALHLLISNGVKIDDCVPHFISGIVEAEKAYIKVTQSSPEDLFSDKIMKLGMERVNFFISQWQEIFPILNKTSRGAILGING
ncbi:MAG: hypothetical protein V4512_16185 [Pseudomonadota bacterium]